MSNLVFPSSLPGITIGVKRRPIYATTVQTAKSGKELRASWQSYPRYRYALNFEFVRSDATNQEFQTLMGLFARTMGAWDSFLLTDPDDSTVTLMPFGRGDSTTTAFQLQRSLVPSAQLPADASKTFWPGVGDGFEPVYDLNGAATIYHTDWQGQQRLYSTARTNLLLMSRDFNTAPWIKTRITVSSNAITAPDGALEGDKFIEAATTGSHNDAQNFACTAGQAYTCWAVVKAAERDRVDLALGGSFGSMGVTFNLTAGTAVPRLGTATWIMTSLGGGWWLVAITGTALATGTATLYVSVADGTGAVSYTGDGASGIYVSDSQVDTGSVATARIITTTAPVTVTDYTLNSTGLVTLASAPLAAAILAWSGSYYRRVRFEEDELDFERIFYQIWEAKTVALKSVK